MSQLKATHQSGFTLLETLVALAILSLSLVVMYQIFTDGFRAKRQTLIVQTCLEHAEDIKDRLKIEARPRGTVRSGSGEFPDGFTWSVSSGASVSSVGSFSLLSYQVSVASPTQEGSVTLVSYISVSTNADER